MRENERMKFWINLLVSLAIGAVCVYFVWPKREDYEAIKHSFATLDWKWVWIYVGSLVGVHFFRAWRWDFLLRPVGVRIGFGRLMAVSSVGFLAILALPARLGEFVRPYLIAERGKIGMSEAIGTVAVERIADGLMISFLVFFSFLSLAGPNAPGWMMPAAYGSLALFVTATAFLVVGVMWPERTSHLAVKFTLLDRIAPKFGKKLESFLLSVCKGFRVLSDWRNLALFLFGTAAYWFINGLGMWLLAKGFGLPLSLVAAFATMGLTGVIIMAPNAPGLVGQFHAGIILGMGLYLSPAYVNGPGKAYALFLHGIQVVWYVSLGLGSMLSSHVSFTRVVRESQHAAVEKAAA
jgi:uncharacterized protein (TIRG00374 family)